MTSVTFLLLNLALAFYNAGTIWAHEVDIFRSWKLVPADAFPRVQSVHWKKLPFWIFLPVAAGFAGSVGLIWYRPADSPEWALWSALGCQAASPILTALLWGPWQAKLSRDPRGAESPYLARILSTHWIRTALINANAIVLLVWANRCAFPKTK